MLPFLVDSHCHLDDHDFDADREAVIERARAAGLRYLLNIGAAEQAASVESAISLADHHDWIYMAAGIHPHEARQFQPDHLDELRKLARHPKFVAIGEIGLDYHYDHSPPEVQKHVLATQLELAQEVELPIIIHCRDAWADLREITRTHWRDSFRGGILHCFTGSREDAMEFLGRGFLISFAGNLTFKKADNLRDVARDIPIDRLLTETDCPYLAPVPHRGKRNEPAHVRAITSALANLHSMTEDGMGEQVAQNFARLIRRP